MTDKSNNRLWIATHAELAENNNYKKMDVIYAGAPASVIVLRFQGVYLAYLNLCVHMPRELDCQTKDIFDETGKYLRCSMHGIVYDPITGKSCSTMCNEEKLTAVRIQQDQQGIWIKDKRVKARPNDKNAV